MKLPSCCKQKHTDNSGSSEARRNSKQLICWMDSRPTYHRGRFSVITKKSKITFPHIFIAELIRSTFFTKQNNHFYNSLLYYLNTEATFLRLLWLLIEYNYLFIIIKTGFMVTWCHTAYCVQHTRFENQTVFLLPLAKARCLWENETTPKASQVQYHTTG